MPAHHLNVEQLLDLLEEARDRRGVSLRRMADDMDISASTFTRLRKGTCPSADALVSMLWWLGFVDGPLSRAGIVREGHH